MDQQTSGGQKTMGHPAEGSPAGQPTREERDF
jgi:hypothetical protein